MKKVIKAGNACAWRWSKALGAYVLCVEWRGAWVETPVMVSAGEMRAALGEVVG